MTFIVVDDVADEVDSVAVVSKMIDEMMVKMMDKTVNKMMNDILFPFRDLVAFCSLCTVPLARLATGAVSVVVTARVRPLYGLVVRMNLPYETDVFVYHHPTCKTSGEGAGVVIYSRLNDEHHLLSPYSSVVGSTKSVSPPGANSLTHVVPNMARSVLLGPARLTVT